MANPLLRALLARTRKTLLVPFTSSNFSKPFSPIPLQLNPLNPPLFFDLSTSRLPSTWCIAKFSTEALIHGSSSPSLTGDKDKIQGKKKSLKKSRFDFTKVDANLLPTVILVGRPNVGKSALFNRLIKRREALVYNTPGDHVTCDIREGIAKLGDLRFRVLDSAGLETAATSVGKN